MSEAKNTFLREYFAQWDRDIDRAAELVGGERFLLEGILTLSCYIGAFAALRYPDIPEEVKRYPRVVLEYSGKREFYEKIDLLFFFQWPRSIFSDKGAFAKLKHHAELVAAKKYGSEEDVKHSEHRYAAPEEIVAVAKAANIPSFDEANLRGMLPLFSLADILYRYLRCEAVHNASFPLFNESRGADGKISQKPNHALSQKGVLLETTKAILANLRDECLAKNKWPYEL